MKKKNCLYITLAALTALAVFVLVSTMAFPAQGIALGFGPALFPRLVCGGILLCILIIFIQTLFDKKMNKEKIEIKWGEFKRLFVLLGAGIFYAAMLRYLGFLVMNTIFLLFTLKYYNNGWGVTIFSSALITTALYIVFRVALRVPLPVGTLFGI